MATSDFTYESLCTQYPEEGVPYVLKIGLIHLLPKFHGLVGEDPHKNLNGFCHTLISSGDLCLMTCDLSLVLVRCLAPIIRQFVKFRDMPENKRKY